MKKYFYALLLLITVSCARTNVDPINDPSSIEGKWSANDTTTWYYDFQPKTGKMYINDVGTDREGDIVVTDSILWMDYSGTRRKFTYICVVDTLKITTTPPLPAITSVYRRFK